VLGYFIEVPARVADPMLKPPLANDFIHRQTMAGAVRFSTTELAELAGRISRAEEESKALEIALFDGFCARVSAPKAKRWPALRPPSQISTSPPAMPSGPMRPAVCAR
jgi:DNA mismatch repair ATPase MutS